MANKYEKSFSSSSVIKEMQTKATGYSRSYPLEGLKLKRLTVLNVNEEMEKCGLSYNAVRM